MALVHVIIISILQGVSELFPVSSLGHAVLLPRILRWGINEKSESWLAFLFALHVGTAVALLIYFRSDWATVAQAFIRSVQTGQVSGDQDQRLAWMVVLGTIPAGFVGLVLQTPGKIPRHHSIELARCGYCRTGPGERTLSRDIPLGHHDGCRVDRRPHA